MRRYLTRTQDDSKLRRGKDCVHLIYGVDVAVNAGNGATALVRHSWVLIASLPAMYYFPLAELRDMRKKNVLSADTLLRAYEVTSSALRHFRVLIR